MPTKRKTSESQRGIRPGPYKTRAREEAYTAIGRLGVCFSLPMMIRRLSGITLGCRSSNPSWPTQGYLTSKPNTSHTGHTHQKPSVAQTKSSLASGEVTAQNMCCLPSVACHLCHGPWKCYCSEKIWYHCSFYLG